MNELQILNAVTTRLSAQFNSCSVELPNTRLDTTYLEEWVRISMQSIAPARINLDDGIMRRGYVYAQIFVKPDKGAARPMLLASQIATVFELAVVGKLRFGASEIIIIGDKMSSGIQDSAIDWYQINVATDYEVIV